MRVIVMHSNVRRLVMDQVTKDRRQLKREEWKSIISECRASGMTVKAWCKDHGIIEQTYYRNLKRLREEMLESLPAPIIQDDNKPTVFKKWKYQLLFRIQRPQSSFILALPLLK